MDSVYTPVLRSTDTHTHKRESTLQSFQNEFTKITCSFNCNWSCVSYKATCELCTTHNDLVICLDHNVIFCVLCLRYEYLLNEIHENPKNMTVQSELKYLFQNYKKK